MWNITNFTKQIDMPVIGMIHLRALPGSPGWDNDFDAVMNAAIADADALVEGGVGALMMENYYDVPFFRTKVPPITVASMTKIAVSVRNRHPAIPLGINVLRNDVESALSIATVVKANFVRVNVLCGAVVTDQGIIQGDAAEVLRLREQIASDIAIWADLRVKHAAPMAERPTADEASDLRVRANADAIILSGSGTGAKADSRELSEAREALPDCPLLIGSGMTSDNLDEFAQADGFIVGSSLKSIGPFGYPVVDVEKVHNFVTAVRKLKKGDK
jgi:uncharacterized protein